MTPSLLFNIFLFILVLQFIWDWYLEYLNAKNFNDPIPNELDGIFDKKEYIKSQEYKAENYHFSQIKDVFKILITIAFFIFGGFVFLDNFVKQFTNNELTISLLFIGILVLANAIIHIPFSYYNTFFIEEKYGFNKSTKTTFWMDHIKSFLMTAVIGGIVFWIILWFFHSTGENFWWYAWILITVFTLFITFFYSNLIVPLFNKQTPLDEGELKSAIFKFAQKAGFRLDNIYVMDGSKRSSKANAYFAGFGPNKRIVLYDTLIKELSTEEIIAVLAHEIGHYKKKHVFYNMILSVFITGITLYIMGFFINNPLLSQALGVEKPEFHIGIIAFGILYSPLSEITGLVMGSISRKFEYQADDFAKTHYNAKDLISALKKLSKNSLSNLTPHPWYVFWHYSHPTLLQRIRHLKKLEL